MSIFHLRSYCPCRYDIREMFDTLTSLCTGDDVTSSQHEVQNLRCTTTSLNRRSDEDGLVVSTDLFLVVKVPVLSTSLKSVPMEVVDKYRLKVSRDIFQLRDTLYLIGNNSIYEVLKSH